MTIDKVYINQVACMTFISSVAFKLCMLPSYMSSNGGGDIWLSIIVMMLVESIMFAIVYYTIYNQNALFMTDSKAFQAPIMLVIFLTAMIKMIVFFNEYASYTITILFDSGKYTFVVLILLPMLAYVVYRGGKVIGRMSQILSYIVLGILAIIVFLLAVDMDWSNFLPVLNDGGKGAFLAADNHYIWFGDFVPLLFFTMVKKEGGKYQKYVLPITLLVIFIAVVGFYVIFIGIYGETGYLVNFAFNRVGVYNRLSKVIWPNNLMDIVMWSTMALLKLVYILFTATYSLMYFVKKIWLALLINCTVIGVTIWFFLPNVSASYEFGISWLKYFCAAVHYLVPIILAVFKWRKNGKKIQV